MRTNGIVRSIQQRLLGVAVAALVLLFDTAAVAQPGDLTASDVDAGIASIGALAGFLQSPNAAPVNAYGNGPAQPFFRSYREIADRLLLKRQRGEIAIGANNLPPLKNSAAKPRKAATVLKLDPTLGGAWQGAIVAATRHAQRDAWGYDGAVARALLQALAREQPKALLQWHTRQLARTGMAANRSSLSPSSIFALSPYWLTKDRYLWAANLARLDPDLFARREWDKRESAGLFEMTDVLAAIERDLGKAWRKKLGQDWNGFRRGIENAASNPAAMAKAARFLSESQAGPTAPLSAGTPPEAPEVSLQDWAIENSARETQVPDFVAPKPVALPATQPIGTQASQKPAASWGWTGLVAFLSVLALALVMRRRKARRPPVATIDVMATESPPPDLAPPDLAPPDLAPPDLAPLQLAPAELAPPDPAPPDPAPLEPVLSPSPSAHDHLKVDDRLGPGERYKAAALAEILTDIDPALRRQWSNELCRKLDAPRYLVRALACDDIAIALPLLTLSPVLTAQDLQAIGVTTGERHRLAIAMRAGLEGAVVESLLAFEEPQVLLALLQNSTIELDPVLMAAFVALTAHEPVLSESLLARPEFDASLARKIYWQATSGMRDLIVSRFGRDIAVAGPEAVEAFGTSNAGKADPAGAAILAEAITPELMVEVLQANNLELFKNLFGQVCGLPKPEVEMILLSHGGEEFAVACRALGIDTLPFSRMFLLYRRLSEATVGVDRAAEHGEFPRALHVFETTTAETARAILERWRQTKAVGSHRQSV